MRAGRALTGELMKTDEDVSANQRSPARAMRGAPTDAELRLWRLLRDRRLNGFKFRRQVPVGRYIVDFLCVGSRLIVEADGSQHAESRHDEVRDAYLASQGWKVLRFRNTDVLRSRESVLETILAHAEHPRDANPHPAGSAVHLLPEGEGVERTAAPESLPPEGEGGAPKARRMRVKQTEGSEDRYA
jgi:2-isopropylmalate synthase